MKLYWLKGPSNLFLGPFQPSEQLSHIKIGCRRDCNIRKVSMISARQNSKRMELSQILKHHQLILKRSLCTVCLGNPVDVGCFVEWPLDFMYTNTWLGCSEDGFCHFVRTHALHLIGTNLICNDDREFFNLPEWVQSTHFWLGSCYYPFSSRKFQAFFWYTTIFNHNSQTM